MTRHCRRAGVLLVLVAIAGCRTRSADDGQLSNGRPVLSFAEVPVRALHADPAAHVGDVFLERFLFSRVWWSPDRARPHQRTTELPTHFEARIVAAPLYVARIEFPPTDDGVFESMRESTELCLRVRFLRLQPVSGSPVFALEDRASRCPEVRATP